MRNKLRAPFIKVITILKDTFDLLTFRLSRERMLNFGGGHLLFGIICTWIVGMGRYWDNPHALFPQYLGVGSVIYIFALTLLLWMVVLPFKPEEWTYLRVLTFVSLVSPPAIIYAIPVQMFFDLATANRINTIFLLIVALWRLSLLFYFLRVYGRLGWFAVIAATLFPVMFIVSALTFLNLDQVVFRAMAGIVEESPNDDAYVTLFVITFFSIVSFPFVLICYLAAIIMNGRRKQNESADQNSD